MIGRVKIWLAAAGAFIVALGVAYMKGRAAKGRDVEHERLHDYKETRGRMDEVGAPDNAVAARKWLADRMRDRGQ